MSKPMTRPIFYYNNKEYKSAGMTPYCYINGVQHILLMIKPDGTVEDMGGKSQNGDQSIYAVAKRESYEESNHVICLKKYKSVFRNPQCKYISYITPLKYIDPTKMGIMEKGENIYRLFSWININHLDELKLHRRLNIEWIILLYYKRVRKVIQNHGGYATINTISLSCKLKNKLLRLLPLYTDIKILLNILYI